MPIREALSAYAGPIPRRVVPIWSVPRRRSEAWSIAMCHGMIRCALPESTTTEMSMPRASSPSSSAISTSGSTTQPAPITETFPEITPLGVCRILNVSSPTMIVCPALGPPW